jgi:hypothetical protein
MRARNLKPGFFKNPELLELPPEARLLFAGLWCVADKAGRLEDRPRKIKIELFPADTFEVEPLLEALEGKRLIHRYTVDGVGYIQVVNFGKHQNPHKTEAESRIPPPPGSGESTEQLPLDNGSRPADSLIPDSLIPSSLRSERARRPSRKCPDDFVIPDEAKAAMRLECPTVNLELETRKFRDHTYGTARSDWLGTWRNWIRKAPEMSPRANQAPTASPNVPTDRDWTDLRHRADKIGFRAPREGESVQGYQTLVAREEDRIQRGRSSSGPVGVGKLLEGRA